jgi:hypothetical protein
MSDDQTRTSARLAELQRDEAMRTLDSVRVEFTQALREHRANELNLAQKVRETESRLAQAQDRIAHMERSLFWRARSWLMRSRGPS